MITIKTDQEIAIMKIAGNLVYKTHQYLKSFIKVGVTTKELDKLAYDFIIENGGTPSFKGYSGFPASICTSINDQVVHGIPNDYKLQSGDLVSIDIGACYKGYHGDSAWSYLVGKASDDKKYLLMHTENALYEGLKAVKAGNKIGDIGYAIEQYANKYQLGVVKELVGHGIGKKLHEDPDVPNYGKKGTGITLKEGMVIAIEPMINLGSPEICINEDGWTIETFDGNPSAHFEHTIAVTKEGYQILTGE